MKGGDCQVKDHEARLAKRSPYFFSLSEISHLNCLTSEWQFPPLNDWLISLVPSDQWTCSVNLEDPKKKKRKEKKTTIINRVTKVALIYPVNACVNLSVWSISESEEATRQRPNRDMESQSLTRLS